MAQGLLVNSENPTSWPLFVVLSSFYISGIAYSLLFIY